MSNNNPNTKRSHNNAIEQTVTRNTRPRHDETQSAVIDKSYVRAVQEWCLQQRQRHNAGVKFDIEYFDFVEGYKWATAETFTSLVNADPSTVVIYQLASGDQIVGGLRQGTKALAVDLEKTLVKDFSEVYMFATDLGNQGAKAYGIGYSDEAVLMWAYKYRDSQTHPSQTLYAVQRDDRSICAFLDIDIDRRNGLNPFFDEIKYRATVMVAERHMEICFQEIVRASRCEPEYVLEVERWYRAQAQDLLAKYSCHTHNPFMGYEHCIVLKKFMQYASMRWSERVEKGEVAPCRIERKGKTEGAEVIKYDEHPYDQNPYGRMVLRDVFMTKKGKNNRLVPLDVENNVSTWNLKNECSNGASRLHFDDVLKIWRQYSFRAPIDPRGRILTSRDLDFMERHLNRTIFSGNSAVSGVTARIQSSQPQPHQNRQNRSRTIGLPGQQQTTVLVGVEDLIWLVKASTFGQRHPLNNNALSQGTPTMRTLYRFDQVVFKTSCVACPHKDHSGRKDVEVLITFSEQNIYLKWKCWDTDCRGIFMQCEWSRQSLQSISVQGGHQNAQALGNILRHWNMVTALAMGPSAMTDVSPDETDEVLIPPHDLMDSDGYLKPLMTWYNHTEKPTSVFLKAGTGVGKTKVVLDDVSRFLQTPPTMRTLDIGSPRVIFVVSNRQFGWDLWKRLHQLGGPLGEATFYLKAFCDKAPPGNLNDAVHLAEAVDIIEFMMRSDAPFRVSRSSAQRLAVAHDPMDYSTAAAPHDTKSQSVTPAWFREAWEEIFEAQVLIVTVESLWRAFVGPDDLRDESFTCPDAAVRTKRVGCLVIDEVDSLLDHALSSSTMKQPRAGHMYASQVKKLEMLHAVIRHSHTVYCMSAFQRQIDRDLIFSIRGTDVRNVLMTACAPSDPNCYTVIIPETWEARPRATRNSRRRRNEDSEPTATVTSTGRRRKRNVVQWQQNLIHCIQQNQKVFVFLDSKAETVSLAKGIEQVLGNSDCIGIASHSVHKDSTEIKAFLQNSANVKIGVLSSETSDVEKQFMQETTNWKLLDVVICSPSLGVGSDFSEEHFDVGFGFHCATSISTQQFANAIRRVRKFRQKSFTIVINSSSNHTASSRAREQLRLLLGDTIELLPAEWQRYSYQIIDHREQDFLFPDARLKEYLVPTLTATAGWVERIPTVEDMDDATNRIASLKRSERLELAIQINNSERLTDTMYEVLTNQKRSFGPASTLSSEKNWQLARYDFEHLHGEMSDALMYLRWTNFGRFSQQRLFTLMRCSLDNVELFVSQNTANRGVRIMTKEYHAFVEATTALLRRIARPIASGIPFIDEDSVLDPLYIVGQTHSLLKGFVGQGELACLQKLRVLLGDKVNRELESLQLTMSQYEGLFTPALQNAHLSPTPNSPQNLWDIFDRNAYFSTLDDGGKTDRFTRIVNAATEIIAIVKNLIVDKLGLPLKKQRATTFAVQTSASHEHGIKLSISTFNFVSDEDIEQSRTAVDPDASPSGTILNKNNLRLTVSEIRAMAEVWKSNDVFWGGCCTQPSIGSI